MNLVLKILLVVVLLMIGGGFMYNQIETGQGEKIIGIGVLIFAFVLMPLFIYHRYKNKNLKDYSFKFPSKEDEKES